MSIIQVLQCSEKRPNENIVALCALLWWSLRYDHCRIDDKLPVRLYLNPPFLYSSKPRQLEVVIARPEKLDSFGWAVGGTGEPWQLGPPDLQPSVVRGQLELYGIHGLKSYVCWIDWGI